MRTINCIFTAYLNHLIQYVGVLCFALFWMYSCVVSCDMIYIYICDYICSFNINAINSFDPIGNKLYIIVNPCVFEYHKLHIVLNNWYLQVYLLFHGLVERMQLHISTLPGMPSERLTTDKGSFVQSLLIGEYDINLCWQRCLQKGVHLASSQSFPVKNVFHLSSNRFIFHAKKHNYLSGWNMEMGTILVKFISIALKYKELTCMLKPLLYSAGVPHVLIRYLVCADMTVWVGVDPTATQAQRHSL